MKRGGIPMRRAQLITTFGPGALTITPDGLPLLVSGLDEWYLSWPEENSSPTVEEYVFHDRRLEAKLGVAAFRLPPDYRSGQSDYNKPNYKLPVPTYLFPRWYSCSRCGRLKCYQPSDVESRKIRKDNREIVCDVKSELSDRLDCSKVNGRFRPVPILAVCDKGHIQDFPFRQWVHKSANPICVQTMYIIGLGGAVEQQVIRCACGAERRLTGILDCDLNQEPASSILSQTLTDGGSSFGCRGLKAWTGAVQEKCERPLVGVLSTGTNVYYSDVRSSIFLPTIATSAAGAVSQEVLDALQSPGVQYLTANLNPESSLELLNFVASDLATRTNLERSIVVEGLQYLLANRNVEHQLPQDTDYDERMFRQDEYRILSASEPLETEHLTVEPVDLTPWLKTCFSRVSLVRRLRETRTLVGFSRLTPPGPAPLSQKRKMLWRAEPASPELRWLPGYFVHGEGIFFEIHPDIVSKLAVSAVMHRRLENAPSSRVVDKSAAFVLIHTLSHLLMKRLSFECGYGAASLRERLYVLTDPETRMHGVLIYTAQSDSEGSMGGLVRLGANAMTLERILRTALEEACWCSSDPVCREIGKEIGQGPGNLNGAACHACCHLPETSCECYNLLLDRTILLGDERGTDAAFRL